MTQTKDNSNAAREAGHTPGPWETSRFNGDQWEVCAAGGGDAIAIISGDNAPSDARLIAAAPDLLVSAELALGSLEALGADNGTVRALRAAIAKAKGAA